MTTTHAPVARQAAHAARPLIAGVPPVPQVNLLPPEIRASRSLAALKRVLALVLVAVLAVGVAGYFWAGLQVQSAEDELADQEAESARLLNAQREFAEVPAVLGRLERARDARLLGTSTEILWAPYLRALITTAPPGTQFAEITYTGAEPNTGNPLTANPLLREEYTGTISFTGRAPTAPDVASWIEALESVENFTDAFVTSSEISDRDVDGNLVAYYEVVGSVQVEPGALALRFAEQPEGDAADETGGGGSDEEARG